ncbi:DUF4249 domain-containing protein [Mucilaginibacter mali]|uniref:DUF4249 domain-containing protein n=1 Tax=Mucilaginibacter mali TaxID=2740462 RepID=A0A7D4QDQ0_9SPHI|nr:DUF4249 domain-containing protein [Mucilaginibacter mali]QKJ29072.1 DUF4249 domain-containing protein [Mucilaginibacter mali]
MRRYLLLIPASILHMAIASCQRVIDIKIGNNDEKIVIEGKLTNVAGVQTITISKTVAYDDANVYPPVTGAAVTVASTTGTTTFKETQPGQYTLANTRGRSGTAYTMTVKLGDKTYTATSVMPNQVTLDSINISGLAVGKKTVKTVSAFYHDPPDAVNQYNFLMFVNGVQVKQVFTINDNLSNGRIVNSTLYQYDIELKTGDKVEVEMQCIDKNVYNYWYNLGQQGGNGPANSATPSNPTSNISNGALGYFSAYTVQRKSIMVL